MFLQAPLHNSRKSKTVRIGDMFVSKGDCVRFMYHENWNDQAYRDTFPCFITDIFGREGGPFFVEFQYLYTYEAAQKQPAINRKIKDLWKDTDPNFKPVGGGRELVLDQYVFGTVSEICRKGEKDVYEICEKQERTRELRGTGTKLLDCWGFGVKRIVQKLKVFKDPKTFCNGVDSYIVRRMFYNFNNKSLPKDQEALCLSDINYEEDKD
jgi:hypothetical protein